MVEKQLRLGDILVDDGCITEMQLKEALDLQKKGNSKRLGALLLDEGIITEAQLLDALSRRLSIPLVDLRRVSVDRDAVAMIPKAVAVKYNILPITKDDGNVTLVVDDPLNFYAIEDVKSFLPMPARLVLASREAIHQAINRYYAEIDAKKAVNNANIAGIGVRETINVDQDEDAPVINLVNSILVKAYSEGASDIHFEPFEDHMSIRYRVDGMLIDYIEIEVGISLHIQTRIKIIGGLDIAEQRLPQDGNVKTTIEGIDMNLRVSTMPTVFGEKIVMRFLSQHTVLDNVAHLGMNERDYQKLSSILESPHGMVFITGPTGSGKTTTLYMAIAKMAEKNINVCTVEDPVERNLPRVNQVQVNETVGLNFETGLRALLRQDPDVILVGETRDAQTAQTAIRGAITGHLVLSTLHTNDAIGAITRLEDMGIPRYLIGSALVGVVAQRLVKKICPFCKIHHNPTEEECNILGSDATVYFGTGCSACNHTGYKGRMAVHEILVIDKVIKSMIVNDASIEDIYQYVEVENKINFLQNSVLNLVLEGKTTIEEYKKFSITVV